MPFLISPSYGLATSDLNKQIVLTRDVYGAKLKLYNYVLHI